MDGVFSSIENFNVLVQFRAKHYTRNGFASHVVYPEKIPSQCLGCVKGVHVRNNEIVYLTRRYNL